MREIIDIKIPGRKIAYCSCCNIFLTYKDSDVQPCYRRSDRKEEGKIIICPVCNEATKLANALWQNGEIVCYDSKF